jgi:hypothetical protein
MLLEISELNLTIYHNASDFTLYLLEKCDSGLGEKALEVKNKLIGGGGDAPVAVYFGVIFTWVNFCLQWFDEYSSIISFARTKLWSR